LFYSFKEVFDMTSIHCTGYEIFIGGIWEPLSHFVSMKSYTKVAVLTDENTSLHCLPVFQQHADFEMVYIEIPAGEKYKNLDTCRQVWEDMMRLCLDRSSLLINLGGGVVGDLGGFCAATYLRGIDFVQVPTTLLSQVDASIGGKVGVDFQFVKNVIGVFQNPQAVFIEPLFLQTLPLRELRSGFAEIVKHALIADERYWEKLKAIGDLSRVNWEDFIAPSLAVKHRIVSADPLEKGLRKALNFGHTVGHAVESFSLQSGQPLLHGEAVALGMLCESWLSHRVAGLPAADLADIESFVRRFYESYSHSTDDFSHLINLMRKDKKNESGHINFTLLPSLGSAVLNRQCSADLIEESLRRYLL
jgi:3-dehydroquinate synthase